MIKQNLNLVVSRGEISSVWELDQINDDACTRITFPSFIERDILPSSCFIRSMKLPSELVEAILTRLFFIYLNSYNFDLCIDLFKFTKSFTKNIYRLIYGSRNIGRHTFITLYIRLARSFYLLADLHDNYLSVEFESRFTCAKFVSRNFHKDYRPWHFIDPLEIVPTSAEVYDEEYDQYQVQVGPCYGDVIWLKGRSLNGVFMTKQIKTPMIGLVFCNNNNESVFDPDYMDPYFTSFFGLFKLAYGPNTGVFLLTDDNSDDNPFLVNSEVFLLI